MSCVCGILIVIAVPIVITAVQQYLFVAATVAEKLVAKVVAVVVAIVGAATAVAVVVVVMGGW